MDTTKIVSIGQEWVNIMFWNIIYSSALEKVIWGHWRFRMFNVLQPSEVEAKAKAEEEMMTKEVESMGSPKPSNQFSPLQEKGQGGEDGQGDWDENQG